MSTTSSSTRRARRLRGAKGGLSFERQNGRHWLWQAGTSFTTPGFETNDIGRLATSDGVRLDAQLEYRETVPGRWYREYSIELGQGQEWNYGGDRQVLSGRGGGGNDGGGQQDAAIAADVSFTFPNFWQTEWSNQFHQRGQDMRLTRGGPSMERPQSWFSSIEIENSESSETRGSLELGYGRTEDGGLQFEAGVGLNVRPGPAVAALHQPVLRTRGGHAAVRHNAAGRPAGHATTGATSSRNIDRSTYSAEVRLNYTFKPDLNLDFYAEPFAASGRYNQFGELAAARGRLLLPVDPTGTSLRGPRLQRAVVPQQPGAALGVAPREHALRGLAAGSRDRGSPPYPRLARRHVRLPRRRRRQLLRHQSQLVVLAPR